MIASILLFDNDLSNQATMKSKCWYLEDCTKVKIENEAGTRSVVSSIHDKANF